MFTSSKAKQWIDANYKIMRIETQIEFLKHCKRCNIPPSHLTNLYKSKFKFIHHRSLNKLERLINKTSMNILTIELHDLYRKRDIYKKLLYSTSQFL